MGEEAQVQQAIVDDARLLGYLVYHTYDSRRSEPGFPDLWIVGYGHLLVLELKTARGKVTDAQQRWIRNLVAAGIDARIYRTTEWRTLELHYELVDTKRVSRALPRAEESSLEAIRIRCEKYQASPHATSAIASASDVPVLLKHIEALTKRLENTKRLAAGVMECSP